MTVVKVLEGRIWKLATETQQPVTERQAEAIAASYRRSGVQAKLSLA